MADNDEVWLKVIDYARNREPAPPKPKPSPRPRPAARKKAPAKKKEEAEEVEDAGSPVVDLLDDDSSGVQIVHHSSLDE